MLSSDFLQPGRDNFVKLYLVTTGASTGFSTHRISFNFASLFLRCSARLRANFDLPGGESPNPALGQLDSLIISVNEWPCSGLITCDNIRLYASTSVLINEKGSSWLSVFVALEMKR